MDNQANNCQTSINSEHTNKYILYILHKYLCFNNKDNYK